MMTLDELVAATRLVGGGFAYNPADILGQARLVAMDYGLTINGSRISGLEGLDSGSVYRATQVLMDLSGCARSEAWQALRTVCAVEYLIRYWSSTPS